MWAVPGDAAEKSSSSSSATGRIARCGGAAEGCATARSTTLDGAARKHEYVGLVVPQRRLELADDARRDVEGSDDLLHLVAAALADVLDREKTTAAQREPDALRECRVVPMPAQRPAQRRERGRAGDVLRGEVQRDATGSHLLAAQQKKLQVPVSGPVSG